MGLGVFCGVQTICRCWESHAHAQGLQRAHWLYLTFIDVEDLRAAGVCTGAHPITYKMRLQESKNVQAWLPSRLALGTPKLAFEMCFFLVLC